MCLLRHMDSHWKILQRAGYIYPRPGNRQPVCHTSAIVVRWVSTGLQYWRSVANWSALSCRPSYDGFWWSAIDVRLIAARSPTKANYPWPPYDKCCPTNDLGWQPVVQPLANHNQCDCIIFLVTMVANTRRWSVMILVVGGLPLVYHSVWLGLYRTHL